MARVKSNNDNPPEKKKYTTNRVNTKNYDQAVYTKDQRKKMAEDFKGNLRTKAAEIKKDLGNDKIVRAPYGSELHKQAAKQSLQNQVRRKAENQAGTGTTPKHPGGDGEIKPKTKLDMYAASDDERRAREKALNKKEAKEKPMYKYKGSK